MRSLRAFGNDRDLWRPQCRPRKMTAVLVAVVQSERATQGTSVARLSPVRRPSFARQVLSVSTETSRITEHPREMLRNAAQCIETVRIATKLRKTHKIIPKTSDTRQSGLHYSKLPMIAANLRTWPRVVSKRFKNTHISAQLQEMSCRQGADKVQTRCRQGVDKV